MTNSQIAMNVTSITLLIFACLQVSSPGADAQTRAATRRGPTAARTLPLPEGVVAKDVHFYSEGIECYGRIFTPKEFGAESKAPAVVLAPGWGETAVSIENYAASFASRGLVAMVIDYRGWGKSGGFLQTVDPVRTDDRLRFSQMTARVRISRKRLLPQQQILDIRNAVYYLQGEPGIDRARVGVWGSGIAGGHVIVIAATDSRIKAVVAHTPIIEGKDTPKKASALTGPMLQADQQRARHGNLSSSSSAAIRQADVETRIALAEYHPFWSVDQIPKTTAVLFVIADKDSIVNNETNAVAASKLLKGPTEIANVPGVSHTKINSGKGLETAARAAAEWFLRHL